MAKQKADGKRVLQFIKDQVKLKLIRAGYSEDMACDAVADITEAELKAIAPELSKVGALGDGSWLKWLKEKGPALLEVAERIFTILSLFAAKKPEE